MCLGNSDSDSPAAHGKSRPESPRNDLFFYSHVELPEVYKAHENPIEIPWKSHQSPTQLPLKSHQI